MGHVLDKSALYGRCQVCDRRHGLCIPVGTKTFGINTTSSAIVLSNGAQLFLMLRVVRDILIQAEMKGFF